MSDAGRPPAAGPRVPPAGLAGPGAVRAAQRRTVCRGCGAVGEVAGALGHAPCLRPAAGAGFLIEEAEVTLWGLCARCQAAGARPAARTG